MLQRIDKFQTKIKIAFGESFLSSMVEPRKLNDFYKAGFELTISPFVKQRFYQSTT